jgi:hypothetical protein
MITKDVGRPSSGVIDQFISALLRILTVLEDKLPDPEIQKRILAVLEDRLPDPEIQKRILAVLEDRLPDAVIPISHEPLGKKKGGRPPLDRDTIFMLTSKILIDRGMPQKSEELIELMREACQTAGISVPAPSTLKPIALKWLRILRGELK